MAGGNPFMPPGSSKPSMMPGANPGGPVGQGLGPGSMGQGGPVGQGLQPGNPVPSAPAGSPMGPGPVPPSKQGQPFAEVHQNLKYVDNQYKTATRAQQVLDHLRVELDQLMDMGDMVRPEQVIEAAGRLVGHGIGATQLATIMSDMPSTGGEGLASWVRMHDVTITNAEQQLAQSRSVLQHQLGVAGIKSLAATHMTQQVAPGDEVAPGGGNALGPGGGSSSSSNQMMSQGEQGGPPEGGEGGNGGP